MATADRDAKIRINLFPEDPAGVNGATYIQSYCLGHSEYVAGMSFVQCGTDSARSVLLSGSGDGTVNFTTENDTASVRRCSLCERPRLAWLGAGPCVELQERG